MKLCIQTRPEFLSKELESIRAAFWNVGEVPVEQLNKLVRIWARDVRELSYDKEDIRKARPVFSSKISKFQKKNSALAWRLKSRRNKKRIATAVCKWRDESNEPS